MRNVDQRTALVAIYTRAGWIRGQMHIAPGQTLLGELNEGGSYVRLTEVELPAEEHPHDFFAIHSREAAIVLPLEVEEMFAKETPNETKCHEVSCLLPEGTLFCRLDVLEGCRVSDYLMNHSGFIPIRKTRVPIMELPTEVIEPIDLAYLNTTRIIGVTEKNSSEPIEKVERKEIFSVI